MARVAWWGAASGSAVPARLGCFKRRRRGRLGDAGQAGCGAGAAKASKGASPREPSLAGFAAWWQGGDAGDSGDEVSLSGRHSPQRRLDLFTFVSQAILRTQRSFVHVGTY